MITTETRKYAVKGQGKKVHLAVVWGDYGVVIRCEPGMTFDELEGRRSNGVRLVSADAPTCKTCIKIAAVTA